MRDDEVDDRWLALAALLLSGIDEPMTDTGREMTEPAAGHRASVADLTDAHRSRRTEREQARSRHPSTSRRTA